MIHALSTARSRAAERSRAWKSRRAELLQEAIVDLASRLASGEKVLLAIEQSARTFHKRSLGNDHKFSLSPKSFARHWYASELRRARKPRIQGKILNLPPAQRERLQEWFRQNLTYKGIQKRLRDEFGVTISGSSLGNYYGKYALEFMPPPEQNNHAPNELLPASTIHLHFHFDPTKQEDQG
jgi:hypothetical protein